MTVETTISKAGPYAGAGTVGPFPVPFRFLDATHLQVTRTDASGVNTVLALGPDYSVAGVGDLTGSVTLTSPLANGFKLTVLRNVPATQEADYVQNDAFPAESHEQALDKLTMLAQQQAERVCRTLVVPETDAPVSLTLPGAAARANRYLSFDADGRPVSTTFDVDAVAQASQAAQAAAAAAGVSEANAATSAANAAASAEFSREQAEFVKDQVAATTPTVVRFSGDGVKTTFTLPSIPGAEENTLVYISGAYQQKNTYSIPADTSSLVFSEAPPVGTKNIEVVIAPSVMMVISDAQGMSFVGPDGIKRNVGYYLRDGVSRAILAFDDDTIASTFAGVLPNGQKIQVAADASKSGKTTNYEVQSGALVYKGFAFNSASTSYRFPGTGSVDTDVAKVLDRTVDVTYFGAKFGNNDDTDAVLKGLDEVNNTGGTLGFSGISNVSTEIVLNANIAKLKGTKGKFNGGLSFRDPAARLRVGDSGGMIYLGAIEDLVLVGNRIANNLLEMNNAGEFSIKNLLTTTCNGVGIRLTGSIVGILKILGLQTNAVSNPLRFINNGNVWIDGSNFYDSDKILTFEGSAQNIVLRDSWAETYNVVADFDNTNNHVDVFGLRFRDFYFQNTNGGAGKTSRIIRSYCSNDTYRNRVCGLSITGGNVYHTASAHLVEVDWNGFTAGGLNKLQGRIDEVTNTSPAGISSWLKSDVANTALPFVDIKYGDSNYNLIPIPVDFDGNLTGGTQKIPVNASVPDVSAQAPLYSTQNSAATTVSNLSGGHAGQVVEILVRDSNTTFAFAGSSFFSGNKGADYSALSGDILKFKFDGGMWHCTIGNATKKSGTFSGALNVNGVAVLTHSLGGAAKMLKVSPRGNTPYFITTVPNNDVSTSLATFYKANGALAVSEVVTFDWEASL